MNRREHEQLLSELVGLNELLAGTPESAVIDRMSLEYRKSQIEEELESNPPPPKWPAGAIVTFNGKPVLESQGIFVDFGSEAIQGFSRVIASLADEYSNVLDNGNGGPGRASHSLLITDAARGSFGFKVEEVFDPQTSFLDDPSPIEAGIGRAKNILEALVGDDEETLAETLSYLDDRGMENLRSFLKLLVNNQAVCNLSFKDDTFRFRDVGQVQRGLNNLVPENISERELDMMGHFQGFLPKVRRAEIVRDDTGEVISARVDRRVSNAETINGMLNRTVALQVHTRQVGNSRPRYTVVGFEPVQNG